MQAKPKTSRKTRARGVSKIRLPDPTIIAGNELKKSALTRTRIMDAAVDCLAETGYARTTTTTVADRANLTRAAMLYHFPSRMALIEGVIHFTTRTRIVMWQEAYQAMPEEERHGGHYIDLYWRQAQNRIVRAYAELSAAARTDPDLAAAFNPAMAEFDRVRRETALRIFPENVTRASSFDLRRDVARYLIEGLAQLDGPSYNKERRIADILGFLKALVTSDEGQALLRKALDRPSRDTQKA